MSPILLPIYNLLGVVVAVWLRAEDGRTWVIPLTTFEELPR